MNIKSIASDFFYEIDYAEKTAWVYGIRWSSHNWQEGARYESAHQWRHAFLTVDVCEVSDDDYALSVSLGVIRQLREIEDEYETSLMLLRMRNGDVEFTSDEVWAITQTRNHVMDVGDCAHNWYTDWDVNSIVIQDAVWRNSSLQSVREILRTKQVRMGNGTLREVAFSDKALDFIRSLVERVATIRTQCANAGLQDLTDDEIELAMCARGSAIATIALHRDAQSARQGRTKIDVRKDALVWATKRDEKKLNALGYLRIGRRPNANPFALMIHGTLLGKLKTLPSGKYYVDCGDEVAQVDIGRQVTIVLAGRTVKF